MDDCQLGTLIIINTIIVIIIVIIIAITIIVIITRPMIIVNDNGLKLGEGEGMVADTNGSPLYNYILTRKSHCAKRSRPTRTRIRAHTCAAAVCYPAIDGRQGT